MEGYAAEVIDGPEAEQAQIVTLDVLGVGVLVGGFGWKSGREEEGGGRTWRDIAVGWGGYELDL